MRRPVVEAQPGARLGVEALPPPLSLLLRPPLAALCPDDSGILVKDGQVAPFNLADVVGSDASTSGYQPDPDTLRFCEPPALNGGRKLKVAVLLSGGVDSSVALTLLKAAGHDCVAFYLQIWFVEDFRNTWDQCPWEDDLKVAQGVCEVLDVPLEVVPLTNQYWDLVVSHSIDQISRGRTPNPDMLCNSRVKFGAFRDWLSEHKPGEFDRVASGHYAAMDRVAGILADEFNAYNTTHPVRLVMSGDAHKDQTYFLAHLSQTQLASLSFPIGGLPKSEIRTIAAAANLPNADRKDSLDPLSAALSVGFAGDDDEERAILRVALLHHVVARVVELGRHRAEQAPQRADLQLSEQRHRVQERELLLLVHLVQHQPSLVELPQHVRIRRLLLLGLEQSGRAAEDAALLLQHVLDHLRNLAGQLDRLQRRGHIHLGFLLALAHEGRRRFQVPLRRSEGVGESKGIAKRYQNQPVHHCED